jgi:hypothetical protein
MASNLVLLAGALGLFLWCKPWSTAYSPIRMFLIGWIAVLATSASGVIRYDYGLALPTVLMVLASLVAFVMGARAAPVYATDTRDHVLSLDAFDRLAMAALYLLTGLAAVFVLRDLAGGGLHILTNFSAEAAGVRKDMWTSFSTGEVEVQPVRSVAITSSLIVATLLPWALKNHSRGLAYASAIAGITVAISSFLVAGRSLIVILVLCLLVSWSLTYGADSLRGWFRLRLVVPLFAMGFYFLVVFPAQRNTSLQGSYIDRNLWYRANARFPDWINSAANDYGLGWLKLTANSAEYFSSPVYNLNFFLTQTDVFSWFKLGSYNITQISQVSGAVGNDVTSWQQTRFEIAAVLGNVGRSPNPWSTGIRDLGIDFGLLAIPLLAILGFVAQTVYVKCAKSGSYIGLVAATYISVSCFIFAFISPFQIRILSNGLWLIGLIALARYLARPQRTRPTRLRTSLAQPTALRVERPSSAEHDILTPSPASPLRPRPR